MGCLLGSSMVALMATSFKRASATGFVTQVSCTRSPWPFGRPLLTCTSAGDTQILKDKSGSVSVGSLGPGVHKVLFESSKHLWWVWGLILNEISPFLPSCRGFSIALGCGVSLFGGIQHSAVKGYSAASCNFGALTGDERKSFSTILSKSLSYLI